MINQSCRVRQSASTNARRSLRLRFNTVPRNRNCCVSHGRYPVEKLLGTVGNLGRACESDILEREDEQLAPRGR